MEHWTSYLDQHCDPLDHPRGPRALRAIGIESPSSMRILVLQILEDIHEKTRLFLNGTSTTPDFCDLILFYSCYQPIMMISRFCIFTAAEKFDGMTKIFFLRNIRNSFLEGFDPVFFQEKCL